MVLKMHRKDSAHYSNEFQASVDALETQAKEGLYMMINKLTPPGNSDVAVPSAKRTEKKKKGTDLNNAVVLERDKQNKRDQQAPFNKKPTQEMPLEIYNSDANAEPIDSEAGAVDVIA